MKNILIVLINSTMFLCSMAHATCNDKESKVVKAASALAELNGLTEIELSKPEASTNAYGLYRVVIAGVRNGYYSNGTSYDITISDDGFCSIVKIERGQSME